MVTFYPEAFLPASEVWLFTNTSGIIKEKKMKHGGTSVIAVDNYLWGVSLSPRFHGNLFTEHSQHKLGFKAFMKLIHKLG